MDLDSLSIDPDTLAEALQAATTPVHINSLTRRAIAEWLTHGPETRPYAPGSTYARGETVTLDDHKATVIAIQSGDNRKQGHFQILTLQFANGRQKLMAAGIVDAPTAERIGATKDEIDAILLQDGWRWRTAVQAALAQDDRFVHFQTEQGDLWCVQDQLPFITEREFQRAWEVVSSHRPRAVAVGTLLQAIWKQPDDGSDEYQLLAFALNAVLQASPKLQYLLGAGWVLTEQWQQLAERPSLIGPRMRNVVPEATIDDEETVESEIAAEKEATLDMEAWRQRRPREVTFTLQASHYYGQWLPLIHNMQQLFLPRPSQVTVFHRFGQGEGAFVAFVNPEQKRVFGEQAMYDAFYENGIYPGARLTISHRESDYEYDLRTRPVLAEQVLSVRRIAFDEHHQLKSWEDEELLQYEVDGDVFVASARWEDLPALFQQAEEAGQGIFGLMFDICQRWQYERGAPLIVTADELFEAIHSGPRLTSKATIARELWRRKAFESLGHGRYQFNPAGGQHIRLPNSAGQCGRRRGKSPFSPSPSQTKDVFWQQVRTLQGRSLQTLRQRRPFKVIRVTETDVHLSANDNEQGIIISRAAFEKAHALIVTKGKVSGKEILSHFTNDQPHLLAAMLDALPGITAIIEPAAAETAESGQPQRGDKSSGRS